MVTIYYQKLVYTKKMVNIIELLTDEKKISKINELEKDRYINFLENSYKDNLGHCEFSIDKFPRWSIISGYYSMHDITKLFLVKKFNIKIDFEVHSTTIKVLKSIINDREIIDLIEEGYNRFKSLASDLNEAKKERVKVQYYTNTPFMKEEYKKKAKLFLDETVLIYLDKVKELLK